MSQKSQAKSNYSQTQQDRKERKQKKGHARSIMIMKMGHNQVSDSLLGQEDLLMPPLEEEFITYDYQIVVVTVFSLCSMGNAITWILCSPISTQLIEYYQVSQLYVDMVSLVYLFTYVPFNFLAQYVLGRYQLYTGIFIGAFCTLLGSTLKVFVNHHFYYLLLGNIIAGMGQPFIMNSPSKIAAVWFKAKNRIAATSIMSVSNITGIGFGFVIPSLFVSSGLLGREEGRKQIERLMFWTNVMVSVFALSAILLMRSKPPTPPSYAAKQPKESFKSSFRLLVKDKNFIRLTGMFGLAIGNFNTLATIIQPLIQPFGFNNNDSSVCGAMLVLLGIIGAAVYGFILDKYQNYKKLLLISNSLFIFGFLLFILGMFTSQYLLYLSAAIMGFNVFPVIPISFELGCELTFPVGEAFSSGILMTASQIVGIIQVIAFSFLLNDKTKEGSLIVIALLTLCSCFSITFMIFTEQKLTRSSKEIQHQVQNK